MSIRTRSFKDPDRARNHRAPNGSTVRVHLDRVETIRVTREIAAMILEEIRGQAAQLVEPTPDRGIEVLSVKEAAEHLNLSTSQLDRLHKKGEGPRRRRLTSRRVVYFRHELDGLPEREVLRGARRVLDLSALADKLRVTRPTVRRLLAELPPQNPEGEWHERDIDAWLLRRPRA